MKKLVTAAVLAAVAASVLPAASAAITAPSNGLRAGDLVRDYVVGAVVPRPGNALHVEAIMADGSIQEFGIVNDERGNVTLEHEGQEEQGDELSEGGSSNTGSPAPCDDTASNVEGWTWNTTFNWYFKISSTPTYLDQANTRGQVKAAASNITNAFNDCGRADNVSATQSYAGDTTRNAGIDNSANCSSLDTYNVVTFGDLSGASPTPLAVACTARSAGIATESDVKYNKVTYDWTLSPGSNCSGKYDIQSVGTHERGHTFGIAHVGETNHAYLTMSKKIKACTTGARTLGLGDMLGLEVLY